ncbi:MAG: DEAD/DEAH box helicase, partial [Verrucomicrobia bacterium]|nr:DEAD/DEAH box helicase [Verrucomicrobiota bacterium]
IRLQSTEIVSLAPGEGERAEATKKAFTDFQSCQGFRPFSTEGLKSQLRGYQETGVRWLWFLYCYGLSGILCDEMGLGKTHQAMALLAAAFNDQSTKGRFLVVCPTSVIYHWQELFRQFLPSLRVYVFYGQYRQVEKLEDSYDVLLTSYGMIRSERKNLERIPFSVGIYDELQQAKNARSQIHRALRGLQVKMAVGLTGTPIENKITDIKALFDLVLPQYLPSDSYFKEHFLMPIEKEGDTYKKQLLSKMIRPFVLRRKKTEVLLELPEKVEEIAYCDLSSEQKSLYAEVFSSSQKGIRQEMEKSSGSNMGVHIFALFSKLKQICDHPCLALGDIEDFHEHSSGKWDLFVELLQEARESHQKVVVFTQYLKMMDIIKMYLESQSIEYAEIRGSTRDRGSQLKKFKEDPQCEVFIASLQAAGVGIDLTAASVVIHYDRWWNPAKENQATDRVHRMGQSRGVQVFKLVTKKTIEERIHDVINQKLGLLDEVVGFDDQFIIKHFSKEEILSLFSSIEEDIL